MRKGVLIIILVVLILVLSYSGYSAISCQTGDSDCEAVIPDLNCFIKGTSTACGWETGSNYYNCALYQSGSLSDNDNDNDGYYQFCGKDCDDSSSSINLGRAKCCTIKAVDCDCNGLEDYNEDSCVPDYKLTSANVNFDSSTKKLTVSVPSRYPSLCCYTNVNAIGTTSKNYNSLISASKCTSMNPNDSNKISFTSTITWGSGDYRLGVFCRKIVDGDI